MSGSALGESFVHVWDGLLVFKRRQALYLKGFGMSSALDALTRAHAHFILQMLKACSLSRRHLGAFEWVLYMLEPLKYSLTSRTQPRDSQCLCLLGRGRLITPWVSYHKNPLPGPILISTCSSRAPNQRGYKGLKVQAFLWPSSSIPLIPYSDVADDGDGSSVAQIRLCTIWLGVR